MLRFDIRRIFVYVRANAEVGICHWLNSTVKNGRMQGKSRHEAKLVFSSAHQDHVTVKENLCTLMIWQDLAESLEWNFEKVVGKIRVSGGIWR